MYIAGVVVNPGNLLCTICVRPGRKRCTVGGKWWGVIVNKIYKVNWFSSVLFHAERVDGYTAQNIMNLKKNWLWMTGRLCVMYI